MVCHPGQTADASAARGADRWGDHCPEPCRESDRDCPLSASVDAREHQAEKTELSLRRQAARQPVAYRAAADELLDALPEGDAPEWDVPKLARDAGYL